MVLGMSAPPPVAKPQPKPQLKVEANPIPEFMWCQRADRVYVTIKVADCANASVNVTEENVLEFKGRGYGMCGQRDYALSVELAQPVVASECVWFASGPNVRVRLEKQKTGPHWPGLLKGRKMVQLKVDWASWLDEDEENERSSAPNGFDVPTMKMMMVGSDKDPLYRDLDKFSSSETPDEGEEMNSILIDEGMNSIDDLQIKFKALEYEKEEVSRTKQARHDLRKRTREAQLFVAQRERDVRYGRPVRDVTDEERELLAHADGLYERLKEEKKREKLYWLSKWWHQRRPEKRKIDIVEPLCKQTVLEQIEAELAALRASGAERWSPKERRAVERRIFLQARQVAFDKFDEWRSESEDRQRQMQDREGKEYTARDMAARLTRAELAAALGEEPPSLAKSMQLKQFADPKPEKEKAEHDTGADADEDDEDEDEDDDESTDGEEDGAGWKSIKEKKPQPKPTPPPPTPSDEGPGEDDDGDALLIEENVGHAGAAALDDEDGELAIEENEGDELALEPNADAPRAAAAADDDEDDGGGIELEENDGALVEVDNDDDLLLEDNPEPALAAAPSGTVV